MWTVSAGELRERVNIEAMTATTDVGGSDTEVWAAITDGTSVPAKVEPIRGSEFIQAQAVQSDTTHVVKMRYRTGITPAMRLLYRSRYLYIIAVMDIQERRRMIEIHCKEALT